MLCTCMSVKAREAKSRLLDISDDQEEDILSDVSDFNKIAVLGSSGVGKTCKLSYLAYEHLEIQTYCQNLMARNIQ